MTDAISGCDAGYMNPRNTDKPMRVLARELATGLGNSCRQRASVAFNDRWCWLGNQLTCTRRRSGAGDDHPWLFLGQLLKAQTDPAKCAAAATNVLRRKFGRR